MLPRSADDDQLIHLASFGRVRVDCAPTPHAIDLEAFVQLTNVRRVAVRNDDRAAACDELPSSLRELALFLAPKRCWFSADADP